MKKTFISLLILFMAYQFAYSQGSNVTSAWAALGDGDLMDARKFIDLAAVDAKTSTWPKTFFYRATTYLAISEDSALGPTIPPALDTAISSFKKAMTLNPKNEFADQIMAGLEQCALNTFNRGVAPYNNRDWEAAYKAFRQSSDLYTYLNATFGAVAVDTLASMYAANAATKIKKFEEAKAIYENLLSMGIKKADIYANLGDIYLNLKDTAKAEITIGEGAMLFPDDQGLMVQELNILLARGKTKEAIDKLKTAISKNPTFIPLYTELGYRYEQIGDTMNARITYEKAAVVDPNHFDPHYRLGAMYYNAAVILNNELKAIPDDDQKRYDDVKAARDALFMRSFPYLETASMIDSKDMETLVALKEIYARLNMLEQMNGIKAKIEALGAQ